MSSFFPLLSAPSLVLIIALSCLAAFSSASPYIPVVTSVSGCVDVGATTTSCVRPVTLTVRGSGFLCALAS